MYTLFLNTHTKAVCAPENGPGIPIGNQNIKLSH